MFTENNYVLVRGDNWGDEYKQVPLKQVKAGDMIMAVQLPDCNVTFAAEVAEVNVQEQRDEILAHTLNIVNSQGKRYQVNVVSSQMEAFCRFSKFKQIENIITWYQNFALVDWLGFPCKIESVTETWYKGKLYTIQVKDTNNLIVSGIIFRSKTDDEEPEDNDIGIQ